MVDRDVKELENYTFSAEEKKEHLKLLIQNIQ